MEDRERVVVAGIQYGASVALTTLQLCTDQDFHRVVPGFLDHAGQVERVELVSGFVAAAAIVFAMVDMEEILHGSGQGP